MAGFRQLHTRMWSADQWFANLKSELKLLFIYLFSNERASVSGLYELPIKVISFETGLDRAIVSNGLEILIKADKIEYDFEKDVIWVKNMFKYQGSSSPKLKTRIAADIKSVPECAIKAHWLQSNTVSIGYGNGSDTSLSVSVSNSVLIPVSVLNSGEESVNSIPEVQLWFEELTGFPVQPSPENLSALEGMEKLGAMRADLEGAVAFFASVNKVARSPAQLLESVKYQVAKRTQAKARNDGRPRRRPNDKTPEELLAMMESWEGNNK